MIKCSNVCLKGAKASFIIHFARGRSTLVFTPSKPRLIHCLPNQIKSGSRCLSLFIHEVDLIALQGLSVHAA